MHRPAGPRARGNRGDVLVQDFDLNAGQCNIPMVADVADEHGGERREASGGCKSPDTSGARALFNQWSHPKQFPGPSPLSHRCPTKTYNTSGEGPSAKIT